MKILAFDTSTTFCSVALWDGEKTTLLHQHAPMQQAALVLPMIQQVLEKTNTTFTELDAIAVGQGPGSFTGIRIASSVAQGIGFAYSLPIMGISSLAGIAQAAFNENKWSKLLVAVDARMGQLYWAAYEVNANGLVELQGKEEVSGIHSVQLHENKDKNLENWYGVGDGWQIYGDELVKSLGSRLSSINAKQVPTAEAIVLLAKSEWEKGVVGVSAAEISPVYLR